MGAYATYLFTETMVIEEAPMWVRWGFVLKVFYGHPDGEIRYYGLPRYMKTRRPTHAR